MVESGSCILSVIIVIIHRYYNALTSNRMTWDGLDM